MAGVASTASSTTGDGKVAIGVAGVMVKVVVGATAGVMANVVCISGRYGSV